MPRYRRVPLSREESLASVAASVFVGVGAATATLYVLRLLLSRDPLAVAGGSADSEAATPRPETSKAIAASTGAGGSGD